MRYIRKNAAIEALPVWEDDQKDGPYIAHWLVYPADGPYTYKTQMIVGTDEFERHYERESTYPHHRRDGHPDER